MKRIKISNGSKARVLGDRVWLANGYWTRLRGLLGRPEIQVGEGMLIAPSRGVHMYGMRYALDVLLLDRGRRVVAMYQDLPPGGRTRVHREASYALELPVGVIARSETEEGDTLEWGLLEQRQLINGQER
jgi:uncharacterized membrane protein (UPF0127 family)